MVSLLHTNNLYNKDWWPEFFGGDGFPFYVFIRYPWAENLTNTPTFPRFKTRNILKKQTNELFQSLGPSSQPLNYIKDVTLKSAQIKLSPLTCQMISTTGCRMPETAIGDCYAPPNPFSKHISLAMSLECWRQFFVQSHVDHSFPLLLFSWVVQDAALRQS